MSRRLCLGLLCWMPFSAGLAAGGGGAVSQVDWGPTTVISTPLEGVISESRCEEGAWVEAGTVLYRLDDRAWRAERSAADTALQHARLLREEAQREMERVEELYGDGLIAEHERRLAEIALAEAETRLHRALAVREVARQRLEWATLRAPVTGRVLRCLGHAGEAVSGRLAPAVVAEMNVGYQREVLFETKGDGPALGVVVTVVVQGRGYPGRVVAVWREGSGGETYRRVRFAPDGPVAVGERAEVKW